MVLVERLFRVIAFFVVLVMILPTAIVSFLLWDMEPMNRWNDIMEVSILKTRK